MKIRNAKIGESLDVAIEVEYTGENTLSKESSADSSACQSL